MQPEPGGKNAGALRWERLAFVAWMLVLVVIGVRLTVSAVWRHNLYPTFRLAAHNWCAGEALYRTVDDRSQPDVYRYSPTVAAAFVPLTFLPDRLASVVWRLVNAAVLLGGFGWWLRATASPEIRPQTSLLFLLLLPLAVGSLNNGQSNPLVLGLLLVASAGATTRRWGIAGLCLAVAILFKVYPVALALLMVVALPVAFWPRLALALLAGLALPFLLQQPTYVWEQYQSWVYYLGQDDRTVFPVELAYRDLRLLCRVWLWPLDQATYLIVQLTVAATAAAACWTARRAGWPRARLLNLALGLAGVWMTVFGAATESSTYILLAPSLALMLLELWQTPGTWGLRTLTLASYALLTATQLANWYAPWRFAFHRLGPHPLAGLLLLIALLANEFRWYTVARGIAPTAAPPRQALRGAFP